MTRTMRGVLHDGRDAVAVHDLPMPEIFPGAALIKIIRSGICGSDLHMNRERTESQRVPSGHEVAGEIVELPQGETRFRVGDRVAVESVGAGLACGECWYCKFGQYRRCLDKADDPGGGFAEYIARRPIGMFRLPDSLGWEEGALVEPLSIGVHAMRVGRMRPGETVAVVGSSPIGLAATAAARYGGAGYLIATARYPHQRAAAEAMGADEVVSDEVGHLEEACRAVTDGRGADIVFETVGGDSPVPLEQSVAAARQQGRIVEVGGFRRPIPFDFLSLMIEEKTITCANCYAVIDGYHDYEVSIAMLAGGHTRYGDIVTHTFSLQEAPRAFDTALDKSTGSLKVHLAP